MINVTTMALMIVVLVRMVMVVIFFVLLSNERCYAYLLNCGRE